MGDRLRCNVRYRHSFCARWRVCLEIIRKYSPGKTILHNFMGGFLDFDHFALSEELDAASWDSYPLGFLSELKAPNSHKLRYLHSGDPDFVGFHHDLYRACGRGRWWVMEQQPGPVNWAAYNPSPYPGMIRFWTHEAFAHGAEPVTLHLPPETKFCLGGPELPVAGLAAIEQEEGLGLEF